MSYITDRYNIYKLPGQSLAVTQCGLQICGKGHFCGPQLYDSYSVCFILEGKGTYCVGGREYRLGAGQGFLITPGIPNIYTADEDEPWKYIYAAFAGADDDVLVHNAGLDEANVTFDFPLDEDMLHDLYAMHSASKSYDALGYDVTAYFLLVMSRLIRANTLDSKEALYPVHYVKKAVLYIENNYNRSVSVKDITDFVGIDRTYLYKLFKKFLGKSPTAFLNDYRLEKAVKMMENKNLSINEIAFSTGFYDVSHFYKAFGVKYKMSPKKYKTQMFGEV